VPTVLALVLLVGACGGGGEGATDGGDGGLGVPGTTVAPGEERHWVVVFDGPPDLGSHRGDPHAVVAALQVHARDRQAAAIGEVAAAGLEHRSRWVTNTLTVVGDASLGGRLAGLPGATAVVEETTPAPPGREALGDGAPAPEGPTDAVARTGAPTLWAGGRRGAGVTVATIDTGLDPTHPALAGPWAAGGSWFDAVGGCDQPCDPVGHGTATASLAVGGGGVGTAPDAALVAARACTATGCRLDDLAAALEWVLAPTGPDGDPDPSRRPDVLVAAWELPPGTPGLGGLGRVLDAAGIVAVFAAGDGGPSCGSVGEPVAAGEVVGVAALGADDEVDPRSSRGGSSPGRSTTGGPGSTTDPGTAATGGTATGPDGTAAGDGASPLPVPALAAPGVDVVVARPGGGWGTGSGTSMAAPLVAGGAALLLGGTGDRTASTSEAGPADGHGGGAGSAASALRPDGVVARLVATAAGLPDGTCGPAGPPNATTGAGRVDLAAALATG
jgi:subtilisin family serine protease